MNYYFFTEKKFTEKVFATEQEVISHAEKTEGVIKVVSAKGSKVIWSKDSK